MGKINLPRIGPPPFAPPPAGNNGSNPGNESVNKPIGTGSIIKKIFPIGRSIEVQKPPEVPKPALSLPAYRQEKLLEQLASSNNRFMTKWLALLVGRLIDDWQRNKQVNYFKPRIPMDV